MRAILVLATLTLASCGEPITSSNQNGGTLQRVFYSDQQLLAAADTHCQKYGKTARFNGPVVDTLRVKFDCVGAALADRRGAGARDIAAWLLVLRRVIDLPPFELGDLIGHPPQLGSRARGADLVMEIPGVEKKDVEVRLEDDVLHVEGRIDFSKYESMEPVYAEYNVGHYSRAFTLSSKIDQAGISADLKDGVLTLTLRKAKEAQPRRIAVN